MLKLLPNILIMSNEKVISHVTNSIENVMSILQHGFIHLRNPTKIWDSIMADLGLSLPDLENGMICFTEVDKDLKNFETSIIYRQFGSFGIAVDYNWALDNGLRKVAYISKDGQEYECLKTLIKCSFPKTSNFQNDVISEKEIYETMFMFINDPNISDTFSNPLFSLLVNLMQWVETDEHVLESEYRIRPIKTISGLSLSKKDKKAEIGLLKAMSSIGIFDSTLKIKPESVLFFICPVKEKADFIEMLRLTQFSNCQIKSY